MTDNSAQTYQCPGIAMPQPPGAPWEGYVACYRAGHKCPPAVVTVTESEGWRQTRWNCPCCGDGHGMAVTPIEWDRVDDLGPLSIVLEATDAD